MTPLPWETAAALFGLTVAAKAPLWFQENLFYYDAIEYLSIGRSMAQGRGFELPIKAYFKNDVPVVHSPLRDVCRLPLYPLLIGILWRLGRSVILVQLVGVALSFATAVACWQAASSFFGESAGLLAGVLAALVPDLFCLSKAPMVEPLVSLLSVGIAAGTLHLSRGGSWAWGCIAGASLAAFVWTRPNGSAIAAFWALACLALPSPARGGAVAAATGLAAAGSYALFARSRVPPGETRAILAAHLLARSPVDLIWLGHRWRPAEALPALRRAPGRAVLRVGASLARGLARLAGPRLLSVPGVLGLLLLAPKDPAALPLGLLAAANLVTTCCFPADGAAARYLLPSFFFLLPLACGGLAHLDGSSLRWALGVAWLAPFAAVDAYHLVRFARSRWSGYAARFQAAGAWLREHTGPGDVLAACDPWILHWSTERPTLVLPFVEDPRALRSFLDLHRARWVLHDEAFPYFAWDAGCARQWPGGALRELVEGRWPDAALRAEFREPGGWVRVYEILPRSPSY